MSNYGILTHRLVGKGDYDKGLFGDLESALRSGEDVDTAGQVGQRVGLDDLTAQQDATGGVDVDGRLVGDALLFGSDILNAGKYVVNVLEEDDGMLGGSGTGVYVSVVFLYRGVWASPSWANIW